MSELRAKSRRLTPSGSAFLDVVRFGAAFIVFLGHLAELIPALGRFVHVTHIAVCIFFVLSGFIIRMVVVSRATTLRDFLIDRASRIYSVVAPALVVAIVCAAISTWINPTGRDVSMEVSPWSHVPLQIVTNLTFTAELWGYETVPIFNSPFWSLSFECIYYLLFAVMFFRWRKLSGKLIFLLLLILSGPAIVFLFPTWLMGALLYDVYVWLDGRPNALLMTSSFSAAIFGAAIVLRHRIGLLLTATDLAHRTAWLQSVFPVWFRTRFGDVHGELRWLDRASSSYYIAGVFATVGMLWALVALDRFYPNLPGSITKKIRWVAEGTFALYLLHLPLVLLAISLIGTHSRYAVVAAAAIGVVCIAASRPFDHLKNAMRGWLHGLFPSGGSATMRLAVDPLQAKATSPRD